MVINSSLRVWNTSNPHYPTIPPAVFDVKSGRLANSEKSFLGQKLRLFHLCPWYFGRCLRLALVLKYEHFNSSFFIVTLRFALCSSSLFRFRLTHFYIFTIRFLFPSACLSRVVQWLTTFLSSTNLRSGQHVALKVLDTDAEDYNAHVKNVSIDSTLHEIKILQQLSGGNTRNVNRLLDAFSLHSQIWIVNEYCPGGSIKTLVSFDL